MAVNKRLQSGADKWFPFYTLLCGEDKFIANRIIGIQFRLKSLAADWAGVTAGLKIAPALNRYRQELVDFTYLETDRDGQRCPLGSHIRRTNPRDSLDPTPPITAASDQQSEKGTGSLTLASADQTSSTVINNRRRILRRGKRPRSNFLARLLI